MGRRPYMTQLALGRSAFEPLPEAPDDDPEANAKKDALRGSMFQDGLATSEPIKESQGDVAMPVSQNSSLLETSVYRQQYDRRGHPENAVSRELGRQSRRAMNNVLATVGVCVGVSPNHHLMHPIHGRSKPVLDRSKIRSISSENTIGLILDTIDLGLISVASLSTVGLRHRLQAFRFYSGISMTQILRRERVHLGILGLLFPGATAKLVYSIMNLIGAWGIETLLDLFLQPLEYMQSTRGLDVMGIAMETAKILLNGLAFAILAPVDMFSTLQTLGLLPDRPLLPHPRAFNPFSPSSPLRSSTFPTSFTLDSVAHFVTSLAGSPLFLWWIIGITKPLVCAKLQAYIRAVIPKPTDPDKYSLEAAKADELDNDSIPGLLNAFDNDPAEWESDSFLEELAKDLQYIGRSYQILYDRLAGFFNRMSKPVTDGPSNPQPNQLDLHPNPYTTDNPSSSTSSTSTPDASPFPSSRSTSPRPALGVRNASTGTLHINPTIPVPSANHESHNDIDPITSPRPGARNDDDDIKVIILPSHRVTALTAYAANSLAHHLSSHIADLLFLPLETRFIRSLALGFLSSPRANPQAQAAAARWKSEVFPLGGWFGMGRRGGWRAMGDYAGKMVLVLGMEMGFSLIIWQGCTGFAWFSGRRLFGWGRL